MVVLSDKFIKNLFKENSKMQKKTHLLLSEKNVTELGNIEEFKDLKVIDLRINKIKEMKNIASLANLTHLYLQNNSINNLEGLGSLKSLEVLFVDFNSIEVIENLNSCPLKKLSVKSQNLKNSQALGFDPICMRALENTLEELNAATNNILSINNLRYLSNLNKLDLSYNRLTDLKKVSEELSSFPKLSELNITENAVTKDSDFNVIIIYKCTNLVKLNKEVVLYETRKCCECVYRKKYFTKPVGELANSHPVLEAALKCAADLPHSLRPQITPELLAEIIKKRAARKNIF